MLQILALSLPSRAPGSTGQVPGLGLAPALCLCLPEAVLLSKAGYLRPGFGVFLSHNPFVAPHTACESAQGVFTAMGAQLLGGTVNPFLTSINFKYACI